MKYLLDTHTFISSLVDESKLTAKVCEVLENTENEIYVSAISFWEISLKFSLKKLTIEGLIPEELPDFAIKVGFQIIPLQAGESASYHHLDRTLHKDPFDRMLIWQAIKQNLTFISKDINIAQYSAMGLKVLW